MKIFRTNYSILFCGANAQIIQLCTHRLYVPHRTEGVQYSSPVDEILCLYITMIFLKPFRYVRLPQVVQTN